MFEGLFEEEKGPSKKCRVLPPPNRNVYDLCGIKNQGATCYLNSLLQTLLFTPEFRDKLFQLQPEEIGSFDELADINNSNKVRKIPLQLQLLFSRLLFLNQNACDTEDLTKSFGWVDNEQLQQHDVQELSRILFDAITDSLKGTSGHDIIKDLYSGKTANTITCMHCGQRSENVEEFLDLTIAISQYKAIHEVLKDMFIETELMSDSNQYFCGKCSKLVDAKKSSKIKVLPKILIFSLLRFNFDYKSLSRFKENGKFEFPLEIDMSPYFENSFEDAGDKLKMDSEINSEYELYSIIIHSGNAHGGHYHAYIRDIDSLAQAPHDYIFQKNDSETNDRTNENIKPEEVLAYVLAKLGGSASLDKLGETFREECGTSWGKMYRKTHGTMLKFLFSHSDTFCYNKNSQCVSLKSGNSTSYVTVVNDKGENIDNTLSTKTIVSLGNGLENIGLENSGNLFDQSEIINESNAKKHNPEKENFRKLSNIWFDFNDSNIKPVSLEDIKNQFEGRESAYMLFYRHKYKIQRSCESLGKSEHMIPNHLKLIVDGENKTLNKERLNYTLYLNHLSVNLYLPYMLEELQGLLVLKTTYEKDDALPVSPITIFLSKTSTMHNLHETVKKEIITYQNKHNCSPIDSSFNIYQVKFLSHEGIHFYNSYSFNSNDALICDAGITDEINLIACNKTCVDNMHIIPGNNNEPMLVTVECQNTAKQNDRIISLLFNCVCASDTTLLDLQTNIMKILEINFTENTDTVNLSIENSDNSFKDFNHEEKENTTLNTVILNHIGYFTLSFDMMSIYTIYNDVNGADMSSDMHESYLFEVEIERGENLKIKYPYVYGKPGERFVITNCSAKVTVSSFNINSSLKDNIYKCFNLKNSAYSENFVLKKFLNEQQQIPLREKDTFGHTLWTKSENKVLIDLGKPLDQDSICVLVHLSKGIGNKKKLNVKRGNIKICILNSRNTVNVNVKLIVQFLKLDSLKPYHLRFYKNDKEIGDAVDPDAIISQTTVKHGTSLVLCEGQILSSGCVQVPLWHFPCNPILNKCKYIEFSLVKSNAKKQVHASFANDAKFIKYLQVKKEGTLYDLKQIISSLDEFSNISSDEVCIRSVIHQHCTKIHNNDETSIKRMKIGPTLPLGVQIRKVNDFPKPKTIVLTVLFHIPGTRTYTMPHELHWDNKPISKLPLFISQVIGVDKILVAKLSFETFDWMPIPEESSTIRNTTKIGTKKSRNKKSGSVKQKNKKPNLDKINNPLCLNDGDILGVKLINEEEEIMNDNAPDIEDFDREQDIKERQKIKDNKNKFKENASTVENGNVSKPEAILKIHVDQF